VDIGFGQALLLFGGLLAAVAALSGVMKGTVLSASVLSVVLGIGLAAAGVVHVDATDKAIVELIELALVPTGCSSSASCCAATGARSPGP